MTPCKPNHNEYRRQAKAAAAAKLNEIGIEADESENITALVAKAQQSGKFRAKRKFESDTQYLKHISAEPVVNAAAIAAPRQPWPFKEMKAKDIKQHPRAADIEAGQKPMVTPQGIGNDRQFGGFIAQVWTR